MNTCNRCKRRKGRDCSEVSGEKGRERERNKSRHRQAETSPDSREVRAEQLLGRSQPSSRRSVVELPCREDTRRTRRSPSHTVDCNAAHTAEDGPESAVWIGVGRDGARWPHRGRSADAGVAVERRHGRPAAR